MCRGGMVMPPTADCIKLPPCDDHGHVPETSLFSFLTTR